MTMENQNPYAPPAAAIDAAAELEALAAGDQLASRWRRLWGSLLDGLIWALTMLPAYAGVSWAAYNEAAKVNKSQFLLYRMAGAPGIVALVLLIAVNVLEWVLLTRRGQSIGKILVGTRVVRLDGARAPFINVVVIRTWPLLALNYIPWLIPYLSGALFMADALFIFRRDRRCLHDLIAGTKVIRVK